LQQQLAGQRAHRFGASSETAEQLQLALEATEIAIAAMTAKLHPPEDIPADKPKRKPIPDHIPRVEVELTPRSAECAQCGGKLRRLGDVMWCDQPDPVPVPGQFSRPMMRARTRLHRHRAREMVRHEPRELRARQLLVEHDRPVRSRPVQLEHILCQSLGDCSAITCRSVDRPLCQGSCPPLYFSSNSQVGGIGQ